MFEKYKFFFFFRSWQISVGKQVGRKQPHNDKNEQDWPSLSPLAFLFFFVCFFYKICFIYRQFERIKKLESFTERIIVLASLFSIRTLVSDFKNLFDVNPSPEPRKPTQASKLTTF